MPHKEPTERRAYNRDYRLAHLKEEAVRCATYRAGHKKEIAAHMRAYRAAHREEIQAYQKTYHLSHREEDVAHHATYYIAHRPEFVASHASYRATHLPKMADWSRRRRALKRGAIIGQIDLEAIKARDKMICCICGKKVNEKLKHPNPYSLSFDHSHPLSLGGSHSQENQRVAHLRCNFLRGVGRLPVQMVLV